MRSRVPTDHTFPEVEDRLRHLADPLPRPRPCDWLAEHRERGQTFRRYVAADPVRRSAALTTLYVTPLGRFAGPHRDLLARTAEYLGLFFDVPAVVRPAVPLGGLPAGATRTHPEWGDRQVLSGHLLYDVLGPARPPDALASVGLTARDLWPGDGWNFVYGEADLRRRVGVWSVYRMGDPGPTRAAFRRCLRRTLALAAHETGHVLTLEHCTAARCLMNGVNHAGERDALPLHPCPACLRKLCWNLRLDPPPYLRRLAAFHRRHKLDGAGWYEDAAAALEAD